MKKFRTILCLMISAVMLFALTACGDNTFSGNFKEEATTEEIKTVMADVEKALDGDDLFEQKNSGITFKTNVAMTTAYGTTSIALKSESEGQTQVVDNKVEYAVKGNMTVNDKTVEVEEYINADGLYIRIGDSKGMIPKKTLDAALGMSDMFEEVLGQMASMENVYGQISPILETNVEDFEKLGVKVYIDNGKELTKIKYVVTADAIKDYMKDLMEDVTVDFKKYEVILVLDADKKLYGIKVDCDYSVSGGGMSIGAVITGEYAKSDKKIKYPDFKDYKELNETNFEEFFKAMEDLFGDLD